MNACFSPDNNYIYCTYKIHLFFQCQVREFAESCSNHEYAGIYIDLTGFDAVSTFVGHIKNRLNKNFRTITF